MAAVFHSLPVRPVWARDYNSCPDKTVLNSAVGLYVEFR